MSPKRLDLRAVWGLRLDYFGGVRSDERSVVNLALKAWILAWRWKRVVPWRGVWLAWVAGWLVAIIRGQSQSKSTRNAQAKEAWIVQK